MDILSLDGQSPGVPAAAVVASGVVTCAGRPARYRIAVALGKKQYALPRVFTKRDNPVKTIVFCPLTGMRNVASPELSPRTGSLVSPSPGANVPLFAQSDMMNSN